MKITWSQNSHLGKHLDAVPHEYDAQPPFRNLLLDATPTRLTPDREAMAAYLAFGRWSTGDFIVPRRMSDRVARAIEEDARPLRIRPTPIDYQTFPVARGGKVLNVCTAIQHVGLHNEDAQLCVLPSSEWNGCLTSVDQIVLSSNAEMIDRVTKGSIRAQLAVAVLFADDFHANSLRWGTGECDSSELYKLTQLISSCGLQLLLTDAP